MAVGHGHEEADSVHTARGKLPRDGDSELSAPKHADCLFSAWIQGVYFCISLLSILSDQGAPF